MDIAFNYNYLDKLLFDVNTKRENFAYFEIDETDAEIVFLRSIKHRCFGLKCGLINELDKQTYKIKEQPKLRKGMKYYQRIVKQNDRTVKIDSFCNGLDVVYLAHYEADMRYLFPFSPTGDFYPTYVYVTRYVDGVVSEEYQVNGYQVVYERYDKVDTNKTLYSYINYVPNGTYKVLDTGKGIFEHDSSIVYTGIERETWLE